MERPAMLLQGIDHVATITNDGDRLKKFYVDTFAEIRERLIAAGASDRVVTEFGRKLSIFFRDPDQMEGEVLVSNPDADPDNLQFGTPSPRFS